MGNRETSQHRTVYGIDCISAGNVNHIRGSHVRCRNSNISLISASVSGDLLLTICWESDGDDGFCASTAATFGGYASTGD